MQQTDNAETAMQQHEHMQVIGVALLPVLVQLCAAAFACLSAADCTSTQHAESKVTHA